MTDRVPTTDVACRVDRSHTLEQLGEVSGFPALEGAHLASGWLDPLRVLTNPGKCRPYPGAPVKLYEDEFNRNRCSARREAVRAPPVISAEHVRPLPFRKRDQTCDCAGRGAEAETQGGNHFFHGRDGCFRLVLARLDVGLSTTFSLLGG